MKVRIPLIRNITKDPYVPRNKRNRDGDTKIKLSY